jgi:hypothetical protein
MMRLANCSLGLISHSLKLKSKGVKYGQEKRR